MKKFIAVLVLSLPCAAQTINPNQVRPAGTTGQFQGNSAGKLAGVAGQVYSSAFSSLAAACSAAVSGDGNLIVNSLWTTEATINCPVALQYLPGGQIQMAAGASLTFNSYTAPPGQIAFDITASGSSVISTAANVFHPDNFAGSTPDVQFNAANAAVIASGGGTIDATNFEPSTYFVNEIDVGSTASASGGVGVHVIPPVDAHWQWSWTSPPSTACGMRLYSHASIDGFGPGDQASFALEDNLTSAHTIRAMLCTAIPGGGAINWIRASGIWILSNSYVTYTDAALSLTNLWGNSSFHDIGVLANAGPACIWYNGPGTTASYYNFTCDTDTSTNGTPACVVGKSGVSGGGGFFHDLQCVHPSKGQPGLLVQYYSQGSTFDNLYLEGPTFDQTIPFNSTAYVVVDSTAEHTNFTGVVSCGKDGSSLGDGAYCLEVDNNLSGYQSVGAEHVVARTAIPTAQATGGTYTGIPATAKITVSSAGALAACSVENGGSYTSYSGVTFTITGGSGGTITPTWSGSSPYSLASCAASGGSYTSGLMINDEVNSVTVNAQTYGAATNSAGTSYWMPRYTTSGPTLPLTVTVTGTLSGTATTTSAHNFSHQFLSAPACTFSPETGSGYTYKSTGESATAAPILTYANSGTAYFTVTCTGQGGAW